VAAIALRGRRAGHLAAVAVLCGALGVLLLLPALVRAQPGQPLPTIVLVHGFWDRPAGWSGVAPRLSEEAGRSAGTVSLSLAPGACRLFPLRG
jgi:pimeloyl-ACP methyl ester carboxylesterase